MQENPHSTDFLRFRHFLAWCYATIRENKSHPFISGQELNAYDGDRQLCGDIDAYLHQNEDIIKYIILVNEYFLFTVKCTNKIVHRMMKNSM